MARRIHSGTKKHKILVNVSWICVFFFAKYFGLPVYTHSKHRKKSEDIMTGCINYAHFPESRQKYLGLAVYTHTKHRKLHDKIALSAEYTQPPHTLKTRPDALRFGQISSESSAGYTQDLAGYTQFLRRIHSVAAGYTHMDFYFCPPDTLSSRFFSEMNDSTAV